MKPVVRLLAVSVSGIALIIMAACSSSESSDSTPATTSEGGWSAYPSANAEGTLTNAEGWPRVEGMRDKRYCEVLLLRIIEGRLNAEVWNSFGLNECPQAEWEALDPGAIKEEHASTGVLFALLNGPRHWTIDAVEKNPRGEERRETVFGDIEMFLGATVDLGPPPPNMAPFTERVVARDTVFEYNGGSEVYEIVYADGRTFIMQAYSLQVESSLTSSDLAGLASRLTLPPGAAYRMRVLDEKLQVLTPTGNATVVQDNLNNTYQLIEE